jgi:hypothetical protein
MPGASGTLRGLDVTVYDIPTDAPESDGTRLRHIEYFHDHVRIERLLFDGLPVVSEGALHLDWSRPGNGLVLKRKDAARYAA